MKQKLMAALAVLAMVFAPIADAKGFSGGGRSSGGSSRSFSSSSSKSSGSSSKPSGGFFGGSSSKPSSGGSTAGKSYSKPSSKVEAARYKDAVKSGKAFNTKEAATADFKSKYGSQYTSSFKTEPATRPSYIPSRYRYNGRDVDIVYNPGMGYGYWNGGGPGLGTFLLYDAISDAAMASTLMNRHGYHVGPPVVYSNPWATFGWTVLIIICVVGAVIFCIAVFG